MRTPEPPLDPVSMVIKKGQLRWFERVEGWGRLDKTLYGDGEWQKNIDELSDKYGGYEPRRGLSQEKAKSTGINGIKGKKNQAKPAKLLGSPENRGAKGSLGPRAPLKSGPSGPLSEVHHADIITEVYIIASLGLQVQVCQCQAVVVFYIFIYL